MRELKVLFCCLFLLSIDVSISAQSYENQIVDFENFDADIFQETLFSLINATREKKRRAPLKYNKTLEKLANTQFSDKSGRYFSPSFRRKQSVLRRLEKQRKKLDYHGSYLDCSFAYLPALQFDTKQKYSYQQDKGEAVDFFYSFSNKKENTEIEQHTYTSLAQEFLQKSNITGTKNLLRTKTFSDFACVVEISQKSEQRMPYLKLLCVLGGYRLGLLK